jgi:hypothetical protein
MTLSPSFALSELRGMVGFMLFNIPVSEEDIDAVVAVAAREGVVLSRTDAEQAIRGLADLFMLLTEGE